MFFFGGWATFVVPLADLRIGQQATGRGDKGRYPHPE